MRSLILAAGQGSRLQPLTNDIPKALVKLCNKTLLERQISTLRANGISDIAVVTGYLGEQIKKLGFNCFHNSDYSSTNMVYSIFKALPFLEKKGDLLISYGDIIYEQSNLKKIINSNAAINVMVDMEWLRYWKLRFSNPLSDAESLILDDDCSIKELGLKTQNYNNIQGQYIGLIKIREDKVKDFIKFYNDLGKNSPSSVFDFSNMFLTEFIQLLIDSGWEVKATCIRGGWLEVDSYKDLKIYEDLAKNNKLDIYCKLDE